MCASCCRPTAGSIREGEGGERAGKAGKGQVQWAASRQGQVALRCIPPLEYLDDDVWWSIKFSAGAWSI